MDRVGTATEKTDPQCRQQMGTPQQKPNLPGSEQLPAHHADEKGGAAVVIRVENNFFVSVQKGANLFERCTAYQIRRGKACKHIGKV